MSDQNETLAAILAEMKRRAVEANDGLNGVADVNQIDYMEVEDWASRIEAAYKQERAQWHAETEAAKDARNRVACRMRSEFAKKCRDCTSRTTGDPPPTSHAPTEPLAAVLAEIRAARNAASDMTLVPTNWLTQWADRIVAAAERERKSLQGTIDKMRRAIAENTHGNAAAMQRALNSIADIAEDAFGGPERDREASQGRALSLIADASRAALAAPARNVDRFATAKEALDAFIREKEIASADVDSMNLRDFFDWLFATAEGEAK